MVLMYFILYPDPLGTRKQAIYFVFTVIRSFLALNTQKLIEKVQQNRNTLYFTNKYTFHWNKYTSQLRLQIGVTGKIWVICFTSMFMIRTKYKSYYQKSSIFPIFVPKGKSCTWLQSILLSKIGKCPKGLRAQLTQPWLGSILTI